jgi:uncharacterized protein DUF397
VSKDVGEMTTVGTLSAQYLKCSTTRVDEDVWVFLIGDGETIVEISHEIGDKHAAAQRFERLAARALQHAEHIRSHMIEKSGAGPANTIRRTCVRSATLDPALIMLRDSKDPTGPVLAYTPEEWGAFIEGVKAGEFDLQPVQQSTRKEQ